MKEEGISFHRSHRFQPPLPLSRCSRIPPTLPAEHFLTPTVALTISYDVATKTFERNVCQGNCELVSRLSDPFSRTGYGETVTSLILLLLHLVPPSAQEGVKDQEVSASQAEKHLVVFKKTRTNIQEHLDSITTSSSPDLLAVGQRTFPHMDIFTCQAWFNDCWVRYITGPSAD
ncbi:uncharacterized protein LOC105355254 [Oryzias latipes]